MTAKDKYEGKLVQIYAPHGGRLLDELHVLEVIDNNVLYGEISDTGEGTAYYLSDGITVEIIS